MKMMTEEMIEEMKPLTLELDYAEEAEAREAAQTETTEVEQRTKKEQNVYTRYFRNVLHFRNVEAARESVARIDRLYNYFERLGDRAGQHQAMILALTGKNRARWSGKVEESQVFHEWLAAH